MQLWRGTLINSLGEIFIFHTKFYDFLNKSSPGLNERLFFIIIEVRSSVNNFHQILFVNAHKLVSEVCIACDFPAKMCHKNCHKIVNNFSALKRSKGIIKRRKTEKKILWQIYKLYGTFSTRSPLESAP